MTYPITELNGPFRITHVGSFSEVYFEGDDEAVVSLRKRFPDVAEPQIFFIHTLFRSLPLILVGDGLQDTNYGVFLYPETSEQTRFEVEMPSSFYLQNKILVTPLQEILDALTKVLNKIPNLYKLQSAAASYFDVPISQLKSSYIFTHFRDKEKGTLKFAVIGNLNPQKGLTISVHKKSNGEVKYQSHYTSWQEEIYDGDSLEDCLRDTASFWGRISLQSDCEASHKDSQVMIKTLPQVLY